MADPSSCTESGAERPVEDSAQKSNVFAFAQLHCEDDEFLEDSSYSTPVFIEHDHHHHADPNSQQNDSENSSCSENHGG